MGGGKRLKELIDQKEITVRNLARETGISATTLYSIIQKDTSLFHFVWIAQIVAER